MHPTPSGVEFLGEKATDTFVRIIQSLSPKFLTPASGDPGERGGLVRQQVRRRWEQ